MVVLAGVVVGCLLGHEGGRGLPRVWSLAWISGCWLRWVGLGCCGRGIDGCWLR